MLRSNRLYNLFQTHKIAGSDEEKSDSGMDDESVLVDKQGEITEQTS